jgi:hypothetical protein
MKRFIITSEKFAGQVELLYKERNNIMLLNKIDCTNATCSAAQIEKLKTATPVNAATVDTAFNELPVNIIEADIIITLDDFIHEYPYKRNMHLLPATWDKLPQTDKVLAVVAAAEYRKYLQRNAWCTPKIANAWLKAKEYLNDWKKL